MGSGDELVEQVRAAQLTLGTGDPADALAEVEPLLDATRDELRSPAFLARSRRDKAAVVEAFCYARVTAVLALESAGASVALPRIRHLVAEALDVAQPDNSGWKVLTAAAEILARAGDADGAVRAVQAAAARAPAGETYPGELRASLRSMFPAAFDQERSP